MKDAGKTPSDLMHDGDALHFDDRGSQFYSEAVTRKLNELGWTE